MHETIPFQTTAHTLSLALGLLGAGPANMRRYAESKGFAPRLDALYRPGAGADLLDGGSNVYAWGDKGGTVSTSRDGPALVVKGERLRQLGVAFVPKGKEGVNLSGGVLRLRYRSSRALDPLLITFKPEGDFPGLISKDIFARLDATGPVEAEVRVPLPASIGLSKVKEVVLFHESSGDPGPADVTITRFDISPPTPPRSAR